MPRKRTPTLTEAELRLMSVIWDRGEATVHDVVDALPARRRPAYNTVLTTLRILEQKNYLRRSKRGRAHVYQPSVSRGQARRQALKHMVKNLFDDSPELLLVSLLENKEITDDEITRLKEMIEKNSQE